MILIREIIGRELTIISEENNLNFLARCLMMFIRIFFQYLRNLKLYLQTFSGRRLEIVFLIDRSVFYKTLISIVSDKKTRLERRNGNEEKERERESEEDRGRKKGMDRRKKKRGEEKKNDRRENKNEIDNFFD